jgi:hypothetical protein
VLVAFLGLDCLQAGEHDPLPPPPGPDRAFYVARLGAFVEAKCTACHREGGGRLQLSAPAGEKPAQYARDFEQIRAFVDPAAPLESRLLRKLLHPADGGGPHVGGAFVRAEEEMHDVLLDFVTGATLDNLTPEVWLGDGPRRVLPRETVILDGRDSFDRDLRDRDELTFFWSIRAKPGDSQLALPDRRLSRITIKPDVDGSYVFSLRVGDGRVWSAPKLVTIEVYDTAKLEQQDPGGISGLEALDPRRLTWIRRAYLDVLGRTPTPPEAIAASKRSLDKLVRGLLLQAESGRAWYEALTHRLGLVGDHRPRSAEARDLPLRIPSENLGPATVERTLILDPAFVQRHPVGRSLAEAVGQLLFDRAPTEEERGIAMQLAAGAADAPYPSAAAWLDALTRSRAFAQVAMRRRLSRFVASGDAERLTGASLVAVETGGRAWLDQQVALLSSKAWRERILLRAKDPLTFVRSLFVDLLERRPTDRELSAWMHAIQQMPGTRAPFSVLARVLIDSGDVPLPLLVQIRDGPRWLRDRFLRYLGRPPTAQEMDAYGKALLDPKGGIPMVLHALVSGVEYAHR